jgi:hypothetical protein
VVRGAVTRQDRNRNADRARTATRGAAARQRLRRGRNRALEHVRRVARRVDADVQVVAWLHEVLEWTAVAEPELLREASTANSCARCGSCIARTTCARTASTSRTWGLIARAAGQSGRLARLVKIADLQDRCLHPRVRTDGWSPPYARGLALLMPHDAGPPPCRQINSAHARSAVCRPDLLQGAGREVLFAQMDRRADSR